MTLASRGATLRAAVTGAARFDSRASFERSAFGGRSRRRVVTNAFFGKKDDGEKKRIGDLVNTKIEENSVIVWSKSYCPFCVKAKKALDALEVPYEAIEIDRINEERLIQDALQAYGARKTDSSWMQSVAENELESWDGMQVQSAKAYRQREREA